MRPAAFHTVFHICCCILPTSLDLRVQFSLPSYNAGGPCSSVGIATGYGLDGPGSNPGRDEIFRTCPDRSWGPPSLLYNGYRVFPWGKEWQRRDAGPSPPSSAVVKKEKGLYIHSPSGPYSLYIASVPVQGYILPLSLPKKAGRASALYKFILVFFKAFCGLNILLIMPVIFK